MTNEKLLSEGWICRECAAALRGQSIVESHTWHVSTCNFCGHERAVTASDDFAALPPKWQLRCRWYDQSRYIDPIVIGSTDSFDTEAVRKLIEKYDPLAGLIAIQVAPAYLIPAKRAFLNWHPVQLIPNPDDSPPPCADIDPGQFIQLCQITDALSLTQRWQFYTRPKRALDNRTSLQALVDGDIEANMRRWALIVRAKASITRAIYCGCANWSALIGSDATRSGAFVWRNSR